jgi:hypothetical protein
MLVSDVHGCEARVTELIKDDAGLVAQVSVVEKDLRSMIADYRSISIR